MSQNNRAFHTPLNALEEAPQPFVVGERIRHIAAKADDATYIVDHVDDFDCYAVAERDPNDRVSIISPESWKRV